MAKKKLTYKIDEFKQWVNAQLKRTDEFANDIFKSALCTELEHVLKNCNSYQGYNDNYWLQQGWNEWRAAGEPDFPEKNKFIYGPSGQRFNRQYY